MKIRELDVEIALKNGWKGPVIWVEDDEVNEPYMFPPGADRKYIMRNDRNFDRIVPKFRENHLEDY